MEQKLWKEFRAACDVFFSKRQAFFDEKDKDSENNLLLKNAIIEELQKYTPGEDRSKVLADLKSFSDQFNSIGHVPLKEKDRVYQAFKKTLDEHYSKIKLEGKEKESILFQAKIETLKASPDANRLIDREKFEIRKQIDKLKHEILQYENNLGFFGRSKGAEEMKKEVERKIAINQSKIEEFKNKLKAF